MPTASPRPRPEHRRHATALLALVALASFPGCAKLNFLKPPSVPRPTGRTSTDAGPAFTAAAPSTPATRPVGADWPGYNNTLTGERYSALAQITVANVASLRRVCTFPLGERAAMEAGPVVVEGTLYLTTAQRTYAIDAATCALRWKHIYAYAPKPPFDLKVNRGVAYADGRLFRGANDGRVYALDARTGRELWNVVAGDPKGARPSPRRRRRGTASSSSATRGATTSACAAG